MAWQLILRDGFQGDWYNWNDEGEMTCPVEWVPDWIQGLVPGMNHRPEYDKETVRARSGGACAKFFTTHASHDAVLYRRIAVKPGDMVRVTAHGAMFRNKCGHGLRVGISKSGDVNYKTGDVEWSSWWAQYDPTWKPELYRSMSVAAVAETEYITVFLYSHTDYMAVVAACYWDDVLVEQDTEGSLPQPGDDVLTQILEEVTGIHDILRARNGMGQ